MVIHHKTHRFDIPITLPNRHAITTFYFVPADCTFQYLDTFFPLDAVAFYSSRPISRTPPVEEALVSVSIIYFSIANDPESLPEVHEVAFTTPERLWEHLLFSVPAFRGLNIPTWPRHLEIILNPFGGGAKALEFYDKCVRPLLDYAGVQHTVYETKHAGHAREIGQDVVKNGSDVAIFGGDGTVHEVINAVADGTNLNLAVVPLGTANALYWHMFPPPPIKPNPSNISPKVRPIPDPRPLGKLYSILSYIRKHPQDPKSLSLALNTLPSSSTSPFPPSDSSDSSLPSPIPSTVITSVVSSTSVHASLLLDAESLRSTIPGLDRFKVAAQSNAPNWYKATLVMKGKRIQKYNAEKKEFELIDGEDGAAEELKVDGPFSYFVSALVDRFEETFVIAPLRSSFPPSPKSASIDLVFARPLNDSDVKALIEEGKEKEAKETWVAKLWEVLGGAYKAGKHVESNLVEYYRCEEFSWTPDETEVDLGVKNRLVCLDGTLIDLGKGGSLETKSIGTADTGLRVWREN